MSRRKPVSVWKPKSVISNATNSKRKDKNKNKKNANKNKTKNVKINNHKNNKQQINLPTKEELKVPDWIKDNLEEQQNEYESLISIYSNEIKAIEIPICYQFTVKNTNNNNNNCEEIILKIKYPQQYPSKLAPIYSISTKYYKLTINNKNDLKNKFVSIWNDNKGECIMFEWIYEFQEFTKILFKKLNTKINALNDNQNASSISLNAINIIKCAEYIEDRKSIFQSFMAHVYDINDIKLFLNKLKLNKKILKATHNIIGYRLLSSRTLNVLYEHFDDDGEFGAGKIILEILKKRNIVNVIVVVSRWYGGIHLNSDRFRHIKNMTQSILKQENVQSIAKTNVNDNNNTMKVIKPNIQNVQIGTQIINRLYWNNNKFNINRDNVFIGCKYKNNNIIKINLEQYGKHKNIIEWIEYITYKKELIWNINTLCRSFDEVCNIINSM